MSAEGEVLVQMGAFDDARTPLVAGRKIINPAGSVVFAQSCSDIPYLNLGRLEINTTAFGRFMGCDAPLFTGLGGELVFTGGQDFHVDVDFYSAEGTVFIDAITVRFIRKFRSRGDTFNIGKGGEALFVYFHREVTSGTCHGYPKMAFDDFGDVAVVVDGINFVGLGRAVFVTPPHIADHGMRAYSEVFFETERGNAMFNGDGRVQVMETGTLHLGIDGLLRTKEPLDVFGVLHVPSFYAVKAMSSIRAHTGGVVRVNGQLQFALETASVEECGGVVEGANSAQLPRQPCTTRSHL